MMNTKNKEHFLFYIQSKNRKTGQRCNVETSDGYTTMHKRDWKMHHLSCMQ